MDRSARSLYGRVALACALALVSAVFIKLSVPAMVVALIVFLSLPNDAARGLRWPTIGAGVLAVTGVLRFVALEAVPGIVQGGQAAAAESAVARLREIVFAEDTLRKRSLIDPDHDGIGSAALLGELTGFEPMRGIDRRLEIPILSDALAPRVDTKIGPAAATQRYLVIICLPTRNGGFTAKPGEPIDEERAERRFVAYAWPLAASWGIVDAFFIDQDERILVSENRDGKETRWAGPNFPPPCDSAFGADASKWRPWKGKKPRTELPGATPERH